MNNVVRRLIPRTVWNKLRSWKLKLILASYPAKRVKHKFGSLEFTVEISDPLANGWYGENSPDLQELPLLLSSKLKTGARVFDLGAHQAVVALRLAAAVGADGSVIAVEGNRHNAAVARRNCLLNKADNIRIIHMAVSDKVGKVLFSNRLNGSINDLTFRNTTVDCTTIDDLASRYGIPDVLYIDVEGHELRALRGAQKVLSTRPDCFVEVHVNHGLEDSGGSAQELTSLFLDLGYRLFTHTELNGEYSIPNQFDETCSIPKHRFFLTALANPL